MLRTRFRSMLLFAALLPCAAALAAQAGDAAPPTPPATPPSAATTDTEADPAAPPAEDPTASFFAATTVTALGHEVDTFDITTSVTVIPRIEIERQLPNSAADLLRDQPGVDVNGVGINQARPVIRGQRGLRVLFLEDGLRLNNARRQTDFGEITGLVDVADVSSVEVVRGPMSVLYGSDAVGGVLNLVTLAPSFGDGARWGADAEVRYGSAGDQQRYHGGVRFALGKLRASLSASTRSVDDYESASGSFGDLDLEESVLVNDTGVDDDSLFAVLAWDVDDRNTLTLRHRSYRADETGFGFVDPALLGEGDDFRIRITYPYQDFDRTALAWDASALEGLLADSLQVRAYRQINDRGLDNDIDINIGPIFPGAPDSSVEAVSHNVSELETLGLRAEAILGLPRNQLFTYGFEGFRDESNNTDASTTTTTIRFPFPPFRVVDVSSDTRPNAPNAENTSWGLFVQDEIPIAKRLKATLGARYQKVETQAKATPDWDVTGLDFEDDNVVGAVNLLFQATDNLNLLASWGTSFRAPNIIERLFNGPTPEGAGYQVLNADLTSETSENFDFGLKYRRQDAYFEAVWFRNDLTDGIVQHFLTDSEIAALPADTREAIESSGFDVVVQQRNVAKLRYEGIESAIGYRAPFGLSVGANWTHLRDQRIGTSAAPVENQYSDKIAGFLRFDPASGRWWAEYRVRHNASDRVVLDEGEPPPVIGDTLPAFTVHTLGAGVVLYERGRQSHSLTLQVENLTDELYAEFSNASFFRPEPGRNYSASYRVRF
jgi:outer membrane receptor protein involved in Fe transport